MAELRYVCIFTNSRSSLRLTPPYAVSLHLTDSYWNSFTIKEWRVNNINAVSTPVFESTSLSFRAWTEDIHSRKWGHGTKYLQGLWVRSVEVPARGGNKPVMNVPPSCCCSGGKLLLTRELHHGILISSFRAKIGCRVCLTLLLAHCVSLGLADRVCFTLGGNRAYPESK